MPAQRDLEEIPDRQGPWAPRVHQVPVGQPAPLVRRDLEAKPVLRALKVLPVKQARPAPLVHREHKAMPVYKAMPVCKVQRVPSVKEDTKEIPV